MTDDKLTSLSQLKLPEGREEAKRLALEASLAAYDAVADAKPATVRGSGQALSWGQRLKSIFHLEGNWIMDMRIPIGTAAVALLLLPLGYQLYSSTALSPVGAPPIIVTPTGPAAIELGLQPSPADADEKVATEAGRDRAGLGVNAAQPALPAEGEAGAAAGVPAQAAADASSNAVDSPTFATSRTTLATTPSPPPSPGLVQRQAAPSAAAESASMAGGYAVAPGFVPPVVAPESSTDRFQQFDNARVIITAEQPVSTFSVDVDTASYAFVRQALDAGSVPPADAVRVEELVNYFSYDYPGPDTAEAPFKATVAVYPTPWNDDTQLMHIGIKGYAPPAGIDRASNLVFLIDTSGSMDEPNKLPLLKRAFGLLVDQLSANDTVSIVVYAGSAGVVLEPTPANEKAKILRALDGLAAGGSTAGAEGIELAYQLAQEAQTSDGINRVILATDGDFNVGISDPGQLRDFIKTKRDAGISLSVLGFGQGNYNDEIMQSLAQNGNGNAAYIDGLREAQKVLVEEIGGTLETIAQDVKIQVEFNPALVAEYRLIGYETRALNREDFNNDRVDAGDIGAGHTVTAIYELTPVGSGARLIEPLRYGTATDPVASPDAEIAFLKMRYKLPGETESRLIETPIGRDLVFGSLDGAPEDMRFAAAVAAFGQKLRGSDATAAMGYAEIAALAQGARGEDETGYRGEFVQMVRTADLLAGSSGSAVR